MIKMDVLHAVNSSKVSPGDTIVLAFKDALSQARVDEIRDQLREAIHPDIKIVVIDGVSGMVVSRGESA